MKFCFKIMSLRADQKKANVKNTDPNKKDVEIHGSNNLKSKDIKNTIEPVKAGKQVDIQDIAKTEEAEILGSGEIINSEDLENMPQLFSMAAFGLKNALEHNNFKDLESLLNSKILIDEKLKKELIAIIFEIIQSARKNISPDLLKKIIPFTLTDIEYTEILKTLSHSFCHMPVSEINKRIVTIIKVVKISGTTKEHLMEIFNSITNEEIINSQPGLNDAIKSILLELQKKVKECNQNNEISNLINNS